MNRHDLNQRIAALSPAQRAIFEQLKRQKEGFQPIACPLSFAQERLWFLHQLDPNNPAYNIAIAWNFTGKLDVSILAKSLNAIVQRHETLRTAFTETRGKPSLITAENLQLSLPVVDLRSLPESIQQPEVDQLANQTASMPFDLSKVPLFRAVLLQINDDRSTLILTLHHIIADGWSRGILLKELAAFCREFSIGEPAALPPLPLQYAEFAAQQRQQLQGKELEQHLAYWKQQLANLSPIELPSDRPRSAIPTYRSETRSMLLSRSLLVDLKQFSRQAGTTLFMTLLTAFKVLLHRYCDQDDIAIGVPVANRNSIETEKLIGFFVNTIVLRTNLSGNPQFQELLGQVKAVAAAAYQHQDLPFAKLIEELQPQRSLSQNPLFQIMFQLQNEAYQLQNALAPDLEIPGISLNQSWIETGFTKFDLTWHLAERNEGLLAVVEYSTDLFDGNSIDRMLQHFQVLLSETVADPSCRLSELPLLTVAEQKQLSAWNQTQSSIEFLPIHHQFEAQAARSPDKIAVELQTEKLAYRLLNAQANRLAHYLQSQGVKPETLVGIHLERSPLLLVALLAVLKAGAAYLPLDPQLPIDRLNFMVQDAEVSIVLGKQLPNVASIDLKNWGEIAQFSENNLPHSVEPDSLAYVIYTSGSTGKPKGAMLTHGGLANYLNWCVENYFSIEGCGAPVQSSIGFDATITSLFAPLLTGQTVVMLPENEEIFTPANLFQTHHQFSFVKLTPAHLKLLQSIDHPTTNDPTTLVVGGEALSENDISNWRSTPSKIINEYGPTEATVGCCVYEVSPQAAGNIPIGKPIPNMQLYILDRYLQPVSVGVPGEIYIGGVGLARGYYNRPDLTAERFIPNPFIPGTRLYKTGDRARYLPDGNIEYLGRLDHQVKLRGYRIELGEIEAVLCQHPQVETAVVTLQNERLVSYVVRSTVEFDSLQLRQFLQAKLPDYMIPAAFVCLDTLPLTPNGKIDRVALPIAEFKTVDRSLPQSPIEQQLTEIWQQVLNLSQVGIHDNFFELGGDSILSLQIVYRANQAGLQITPRQIFQHQTIAELATVVSWRSTSHNSQEPVTGDAPLTPIQHWFFESPRSHPHHFNQTVLLEVDSVEPQLINQTLRQLSQHHDALRLRFEQTKLGWNQFHAAVDEAIAFHIIDLSNLSPNVQSKAIETTANALQASLNLSNLLWRSVLFRLGNSQRDRLLIIVHHLIVDSVSWQILLEDFATVYQRLYQGKTAQLPPKTTAFRNWASQLLQYAEFEALLKEVEYWQQIRSTPIPTDYSAELTQNTNASTAEVQISLDIDRTQALQIEVPQSYHTQINDVLLTALLQSFTQWTGLQQLRIDLESHGREDLFDLNLSRSIGWFTSLFPVMLMLNERQPEAILRSVKEQLRQIPNGGIGYGVLRYLGSKQLEIPFADIKFNYLGQIDRLPFKPPLLGFAKEFCGSAYALQEQRRYLIEMNGWIADRQLQFRWTYSRNFHKAETIERLAQQFITALQNLIDRCRSTSTTGYTPSDFPAARINQKQLNQLLGKLHGKK